MNADCYYGDHYYPGEVDDGPRTRKPTAVCSACGYVNRQYAAYIGQVTCRAKRLRVSWIEAERLIDIEAVAELETLPKEHEA